MEARSKSIEDWFAMIRGGHISLPRFQRFESWRSNQVEGVLENILRTPSLPIGALLVLEVGGKELFVSRPISGAPNVTGLPQLNLLDGQQRMTALWKSLNDLYDDFNLFVSLGGGNRPEVVTVKRYFNKLNDRMPLWANDPTATFGRNLFPVSILCPGAEGEKRYNDWIDAANIDRNSERIINNLRHQLSRYMIPFLALPTTTEPETALDVFINMNTSATPLKDFDIVVAQLEATSEKSLHEMIKELETKIPAVKRYGRLEDAVLAVGALLNDEQPSKPTYLDKNFGEKLSKVWPQIIDGFKRSTEFLESEGIFDESVLPTEVITYLSAALWAGVPKDGADDEGWARTVIRKTIWRASFTERYSKSSTSRAISDYRRIKELIANTNFPTLPELFDNNIYPVPEVNELKRAGWPTRKDRLGRAILACSMYSGGYDFADGAKISVNNINVREYHHVFPKALITTSQPEDLVNSALNCALISWKTNRKIGAKNPNDYIRERAKDAKATEDEIRRRLESHLVPYNALISGDFSKFIEERAQLIFEQMAKLIDGKLN